MVFWALQKVQGRGRILLLGRASLTSVSVLKKCLWDPLVSKDLSAVTRGTPRSVRCLISGNLSLHPFFLVIYYCTYLFQRFAMQDPSSKAYLLPMRSLWSKRE